jgi:hypothetical protein
VTRFKCRVLLATSGVYLSDGTYYSIRDWEGIGSTWRHGRVVLSDYNARQRRLGRAPSIDYPPTLCDNPTRSTDRPHRDDRASTNTSASRSWRTAGSSGYLTGTTSAGTARTHDHVSRSFTAPLTAQDLYAMSSTAMGIFDSVPLPYAADGTLNAFWHVDPPYTGAIRSLPCCDLSAMPSQDIVY